MPTCTVTLRNRQGVRYWVTTAGETLFEACAAVLDFFELDFWKGSKPQPETILKVMPMGESKIYRIRVRRVTVCGFQHSVDLADPLLLCFKTWKFGVENVGDQFWRFGHEKISLSL